MTETGAAACIMAHREPRHVGTNCFGRAEPFVETRVVDDEGADVAVDVPGELLVRAAGADPRRDFFLGYLKDDVGDRGGVGRRLVPHRRRRPAQRRGRLPLRRPAQERDPAQRREHLGGRGRERAQPASGGAPRAPSRRRPTRCAATRCSPASSCARRPTRRRPSSSRPASSRHALARLAYFKAPGYVAFVDALPLTASQKIQRGELRELARTLPGKPTCIDTRALKRRRQKRE